MRGPRWTLLLGTAALVGGCGDDASAAADGTSTAADTGTTISGATPTTGTFEEPTTSSSTTDEPTSSTSTSEGSESSTTEDTSGSSTGDPPRPPSPLLWTDDCSVGDIDLAVLHPRLQCTTVSVPLAWNDPEGEQIQVAAFRVRSEAADHQGALWMLDGGPGGSGLGFVANPATTELYNNAGWDVVVPSHRGIVSPRVRCSNPPYSDACLDELNAAWGPGLAAFNTVNAAHDVGHFIERAKPDEPGNTVVYGVSYGSFWGHHYLGLHPTQADGVILDSVLGAGVEVVTQLPLVQGRAEDLLQRCVDDAQCGPTVPYGSGAIFSAAVTDTWDAFDCGAQDVGLWGESVMSLRLGDLINRPTTRNFLPLLAALLAECDADLTLAASGALNALPSAVLAKSGAAAARLPAVPLRWGEAPPEVPFGLPGDLFFSDVVFGVVAGTSVIRDGADANAPVAAAAHYVATIGLGQAIANASDFYGDLPNPAFDANFAAATPTMIFNARYDLQTPLPWAEQAGARLGVDVLVFEDGAHSLASMGTGGKAPDGTPCATAILLEFAGDPSRPPNTACVDALPEIDVSLRRADLQAVSLSVFGTTDPWSLIP